MASTTTEAHDVILADGKSLFLVLLDVLAGRLGGGGTGVGSHFVQGRSRMTMGVGGGGGAFVIPMNPMVASTNYCGGKRCYIGLPKGLPRHLVAKSGRAMWSRVSAV